MFREASPGGAHFPRHDRNPSWSGRAGVRRADAMNPLPKRLPPGYLPPPPQRAASTAEPPLTRRQRALADARRADRSIVVAAAVALMAGVGLLLWVVSDVLLLVFGGILFAVFLRSVSEALSAWSGLPVGGSLAAVLLALFSVLLLAVLLLGAEVAAQLAQLVPRLHEAWERTVDYLGNYEWGEALLSGRSLGVLAPRDGQWMARLTGVFSTTLGAIASVMVLVFVGLYLAAAPHMYRDGLLRLVPARGRRRAAEVLRTLGVTLQWWLIGTFAKMVVVGVAVTVGLLLLDIPLALALGLLAFLLEFIPYLGPTLASIPALLVGLTVGPVEAGYVLLLYGAVQAAEGYVVAPLIDQRSVHLPPALAIITQVLLAVALGALGAVFATPLAAVAIVLVKMLYIEDQLGESPTAPLQTPPRDAARR